MKISTIIRKMAEAQSKCGDYHMRAFWAETDIEERRLYRMSDFWYSKYEYWMSVWENHPDRYN